MLVYFEDSLTGITANKLYETQDGQEFLDDDGCRRGFAATGEEYTGRATAGFILWGGGECPVGEGVEVEIFRRGDKKPGDRGEHIDFASSYRWSHNYSIGDIIAYRIVEDKEVKEPEEFKVMPGDYITGIDELTDQEYEIACDAFLSAGAKHDNNHERNSSVVGLSWSAHDEILTSWTIDPLSGSQHWVREITFEQLTGQPLAAATNQFMHRCVSGPARIVNDNQQGVSQAEKDALADSVGPYKTSSDFIDGFDVPVRRDDEPKPYFEIPKVLVDHAVSIVGTMIQEFANESGGWSAIDIAYKLRQAGCNVQDSDFDQLKAYIEHLAG